MEEEKKKHQTLSNYEFESNYGKMWLFISV